MFFISLGLETPRFFQFRHINNGTDFWTTALMEDPTYIQFSSYWDEMLTTGAVPLIALVYFNLCMILKIRASSKFSHRYVGRGVRSSGHRRQQETSFNGTRKTIVENAEEAEAGALTPVAEGKLPAVPSVKVRSPTSATNSPDVEKIRSERSSLKERAPLMGRLSRSATRGSIGNAAPGKRGYATAASTRSQGHHFQKRGEKSTIILVLIVLIFMACHSYRLALKVYEFANPESNTMEHFQRCHKVGRFHVPVIFYVLVNIHHLFLVINSSINFLIYCCVGKDFRLKLVQLFHCD